MRPPSRDVQVALAELAAAQLDTVAAVKRAYYNLYASLKTEEILAENRKILEDFRAIARERVKTGGTQQDVIKAEVLISELDRELANNQQVIATARSALGRQLHIPPDTELKTLPTLSLASVPAEIERLNRPGHGRAPRAAGPAGRDRPRRKSDRAGAQAVLPQRHAGPDLHGHGKTNAATPRTASGSPNVGLFVGFNLPVYHNKYRAGVCEAQERALADAKLYEAQRDETYSEIQDLMIQARVQQNVLALLQRQHPASHQGIARPGP